MKFKKIIIAAIAAVTATLSLAGCGTDYCSYGGCMREAEEGSDRCSIHQGMENDPNYGVPDKWKATGDWVNK